MQNEVILKKMRQCMYLGARRLNEAHVGVSLFVSCASAMPWVGLRCSSHVCWQNSSKNFFANILKHKFFKHICLLGFLQCLNGSFIPPDRNLFRFHTFNISFRSANLPYFYSLNYLAARMDGITTRAARLVHLL